MAYIQERGSFWRAEVHRKGYKNPSTAPSTPGSKPGAWKLNHSHPTQLNFYASTGMNFHELGRTQKPFVQGVERLCTMIMGNSQM